MLGEYSAAMESGDGDAVYAFWSEDFHSHVTTRVSPDKVGTDVRGEEQVWWQQAQSAFPDMAFAVELLIESDDLIVSNWTAKGTHETRSSSVPHTSLVGLAREPANLVSPNQGETPCNRTPHRRSHPTPVGNPPGPTSARTGAVCSPSVA
jgi:SnoaL-like polyketide cyclase.